MLFVISGDTPTAKGKGDNYVDDFQYFHNVLFVSLIKLHQYPYVTKYTLLLFKRLNGKLGGLMDLLLYIFLWGQANDHVGSV